MADGSWSNAFEFRGPDSYHQLADQFAELARLLDETGQDKNELTRVLAMLAPLSPKHPYRATHTSLIFLSKQSIRP